MRYTLYALCIIFGLFLLLSGCAKKAVPQQVVCANPNFTFADDCLRDTIFPQIPPPTPATKRGQPVPACIQKWSDGTQTVAECPKPRTPIICSTGIPANCQASDELSRLQAYQDGYAAALERVNKMLDEKLAQPKFQREMNPAPFVPDSSAAASKPTCTVTELSPTLERVECPVRPAEQPK